MYIRIKIYGIKISLFLKKRGLLFVFVFDIQRTRRPNISLINGIVRKFPELTTRLKVLLKSLEKMLSRVRSDGKI